MEKTKVYFAGAIRGQRMYKKTFHELIDFIQGLGCVVLTEHVGKKHPISYQAKKFGERTEELTAEQIEKRDIAWLDEATHVIAEISGASTGTGREIEYARTKYEFGKTPAKILCLYKKEREFFASPMIRGMTPDRYGAIRIFSYETLEEAKKIIHDFLEGRII